MVRRVRVWAGCDGFDAGEKPGPDILIPKS